MRTGCGRPRPIAEGARVPSGGGLFSGGRARAALPHTAARDRDNPAPPRCRVGGSGGAAAAGTQRGVGARRAPPLLPPRPPPNLTAVIPPTLVLPPPTRAAVRTAVRAEAELRGYIERLQAEEGGKGGTLPRAAAPPPHKAATKAAGTRDAPTCKNRARMYIKERGAPLQGIAVGHRMPRRSRCCAVHKAQLHHSIRRKNARVLHPEHLLHSHPTSRNLSGQRSPSCQALPFSFLPLDAAAQRRHSIGKGARVQ